MAEIKLTNIKFDKIKSTSDYVISTVLDSSYGFDGVKLITSTEELERYYYGLTERQGLDELLKEGGALAIKRLNRIGTSNSTLRLLDHPIIKYTYPETFDVIDDLDPIPEKVDIDEHNLELTDKGIGDSIQYYQDYTYNYVIDFNSSDMVEQDYFAIPKYGETTELDNSVLFYFVDFNPLTGYRLDISQFDPPVLFDSVGSDLIAINSGDNSLKDQRAKIVWDFYNGNLTDVNDKIDILYNNSGDDNFIPSLSSLDEVNNKVTLVFRKPIADIKYNQSLGQNKFTVKSDEYLNYSLITSSTLLNSVVSFKSLLVGDSEFKLDFDYIKNYEYNLKVTYREDEQFFNVSLDRSATNFNGESIFIEDVIEKEYDLLECAVNLGTRIESTGPDNFTPQMAEDLQGTYYVAKGKIGTKDPYTDNLGLTRYPFYDSIDELIEADIDYNLFLFGEFYDKIYLDYTEPLMLTPFNVIGLTTIPDSILFEDDIITKRSLIESYLLPRNKRGYLLYILGESEIDNGSYLSNTYYYALNAINSNFFNEITDNKKISQLNKIDQDFLDEYYINYIEYNDENYYINFITNLPEYIEPSYLFIANYINTSVKRFLRSKLSLYAKDLFLELKSNLKGLEKYSDLIKELTIADFKVNNNYVDTKIELELTGLVNRTIEMKITINK
jgi:hypothetical protein